MIYLEIITSVTPHEYIAQSVRDRPIVYFAAYSPWSVWNTLM